MHIPLYQVDAFTDEVFKGNPACVMLLDDWLEEDVLLAKKMLWQKPLFWCPKRKDSI